MINESVLERQDIHAPAQALGQAPLKLSGEDGKGWVIFHLAGKLDAELPKDWVFDRRLEEIVDTMIYLSIKYGWHVTRWATETYIAYRNRVSLLIYMTTYMWLLIERDRPPGYIAPDPYPREV